MSGAVFLEGENVNLTTIEEEDLEFIRDSFNHPEVRKGIWVRNPRNLDQEKEWFEEEVSDEDTVNLLISEEEQPVGTISLEPQEGVKETAEIGLHIHPDYQGNGYGTEACEMLIEHGFMNFNYNKIFAKVLADNKPSIRLWEKLGFEKEGELREHVYTRGKHRKVLIFGVLKNEWVSQ